MAVTLTGGHRHDVTQLTELVDRVPPTGRHGKFRPRRLYADRAYDSKRHRKELRDRHIVPKIARQKLATARAWDASAGSGSAPSPGCTPTATSPAATPAVPTSTKPCSPSPAPRSASNNSTTFVRRSKSASCTRLVSSVIVSWLAQASGSFWSFARYCSSPVAKPMSSLANVGFRMGASAVVVCAGGLAGSLLR